MRSRLVAVQKLSSPLVSMRRKKSLLQHKDLCFGKFANPPSGVSINFYEMPEALVSDPTYMAFKKSL